MKGTTQLLNLKWLVLKFPVFTGGHITEDFQSSTPRLWEYSVTFYIFFKLLLSYSQQKWCSSNLCFVNKGTTWSFLLFDDDDDDPCVFTDFRYGVKRFQVRSWFSPKGGQPRSLGSLSTSP